MPAGDLSQATLLTLRDRLGDFSGGRWSDATLYRYLNRAQARAAQLLPDEALWFLTQLTSTTLVAGSSSYALPSTFLREWQVEYKGLRARRGHVSGLDLLGDAFVTAPSEANPYYYVWGGSIVFPFAVTNAGAEVFKFYYLRTPTVMSASTDSEFPTIYHGLLCDYAVARSLEADSRLRAYAPAFDTQFDTTIQFIRQRYMTPNARDERPND